MALNEQLSEEEQIAKFAAMFEDRHGTEPHHEHQPESATPIDDEARPYDLWGDFEPPPLPKGLLPGLLERWAFKNAAIAGCDPAGFAMSGIAACAGAIPDEIKLQVTAYEGWSESARLWVALVGLPSTKKTLPASKATKALRQMDIAAAKEGKKALLDWQEDGGNKSGVPKPPVKRYVLGDTTAEAAQGVFADNPNGVLLFRDELSGWFASMEAHNGMSASRAFWLESYNGGSYNLDRVGRGSFTIEALSASMLGGIQPDKIRTIAASGDDDGLIQRVLPVILRRSQKGVPARQPVENDQYDDMIEAFTKLRLDRLSSNWLSTQLQFSEEAQAVQSEVEDRVIDLSFIEDDNPKLASHIGKYTGTYARLCVVWHCAEHWGDSLGRKPIPRVISKDTAARVSQFLFDYLLPHALAFYRDLIGDVKDDGSVKKLAGFILSKGLKEVTARTAQRSTGGSAGLTAYDATVLCERLESLGWLVREEPMQGSRGRPPSPKFLVRDCVHELFKERAEHEKANREKAHKAMMELGAVKESGRKD